MDKQYINPEKHQIITTNQAKILQNLQQTESALDKTIKLSQKYYSETQQGFIQAIEVISRIRTNFDTIYKNIKLLKQQRSKSTNSN